MSVTDAIWLFRRRVVATSPREGGSVAAPRFGVHRSTVYEWRRAALAYREEARSSRPCARHATKKVAVLRIGAFMKKAAPEVATAMKLLNCCEAFIDIVDSMLNQHAKWLKVT